MIEFTGENVKIIGVEFRTDSKDWIDQDFNTVTAYTSWGREKDTCAWFWVSPSEKSRLESQGVEFSRT